MKVPTKPSLERIVALFGVLVFTACAGSEDPRQGGFMSGVSNLASGTYERRVREREQNLQEIQQQNAALQERLSRLRGDEQSLSADRTRLERRVASIDQKISAARRKIAIAMGDGSLDPKSAKQISRRLEALAKRRAKLEALGQLAGDEGAARADQLDNEMQAIRRSLDEAIETSVGIKRKK